MRRSWQTLTVVCATLGSTIAMAEGPILRFWRDVGRSTARNNAWPDPFIPADRNAARAPFDAMTYNGWRYNNTLSDQHFDEAGRLNEAGEIKLRTTLQEFPSTRRMIFVLKAEDQLVTSARLQNTHEAAMKFALPGDQPQIDQTVIRPEGWPASFVVAVDRAYAESMPQPRIPRTGATGGSTQTTGS